MSEVGKIRVLNVVGELGYGGAELQTLEIARRLNSPELEVDIAVIGPCNDVLRGRAEEGGVGLALLRSRLRSPLNVIRIAALLRRARYDIVHAHLFPSLYWVALARLLVRSPVAWIYTEHSTGNNRRSRSWMRAVESWVYCKYDKVVCIAEDVRSSLCSWLPKIAEPEVIDNGIDLERFNSAPAIDRAMFGLSDDDVVIVMVGAFRPEKNHRALLRALALLPVRYKLVLAGDGPEFQAVRQMSEDIGVADRCHFLGAVDAVECVLKAADVYVLPSLIEGFGLSAVEAAAAGLPVVYANVSGLGSIFDGAGVGIDPLDPGSIAGGVLKATESAEAIAQLRSRSIALASRFDIARTAEKYGALYRKAVGERMSA